MTYVAIDLGAGVHPASRSLLNITSSPIWPKCLSNGGDALCRRKSDEFSIFLRLSNGTTVDLPPGMRKVFGIARTMANDVLVLGLAADSGPHLIFNATTKTVSEVSAPGVGNFAAWAVNLHGDIAGRNILSNWYTKATKIVPAPAAPGLPAGTPTSLEFFDLNDMGQATGSLSWASGVRPVYYEGGAANVIVSAGYAAGYRINNVAEIVVSDNPTLTPSVYDWIAQSVTPLPGTHVVALNDTRHLLWNELAPPQAYLSDLTTATMVGQLFPVGSGWSSVQYVTDLNNRGEIFGVAKFQGLEHGFLLIPTRKRGRSRRAPATDDLFARIIIGVINDAGGLAFIGGHVVHIPPRAPYQALMEGLPAALSQRLHNAVSHAELGSEDGVKAFAEQVKAEVAHYSRQVFRGETEST